MQGRPYADELRRKLELFASDLDELVASSAISPTSMSSGHPQHRWDDPTVDITRRQMKLLPEWEALTQRYRVLFPHPTPEVRHTIHQTLSAVHRWIERSAGDNSVPPSIAEARSNVKEWFADLAGLLDLITDAEASGLYLVPDTSSVIRNPDLATYARGAGRPDFTVVIIPTVLAELDSLKDRGEKDVSKKAQAFIRRLKGLRDKGRLRDGVRLTRQITVVTSAVEIKPSSVLAWLDSDVRDDRILASALALQAEHPGDTVALVTSDLNLQNKADTAGLPYIETPATDAELSANIQPDIERRGQRERHWVVLVTNEGPKSAHSVKFQVADSLSDRPSLRSGPWTVDTLQKGATAEEQTWAGSGRHFVSVWWTDDVGHHHGDWAFDLDSANETAREVRP